MPLTPKGRKLERALVKEYGEKKGRQVLYAGKNKGTFTGIDSAETERQAADLAAGKYVSGRDRAKLRTRRG